MADSNTQNPFHHEHPHSRFVDRKSPQGTLYNVANSLSLIMQFGTEELDGVEAKGADAIINECISAIYFEALRVEERS